MLACIFYKVLKLSGAGMQVGPRVLSVAGKLVKSAG